MSVIRPRRLAATPIESSTPALRLAVGFIENENLRVRAEQLARELSLPLVGTGNSEFDLHLVQTNEQLELRDVRDPRVGPVRVDFSHLDLRPYSKNLSRRQPLARAFGKKVQTIVDATAGFGQDALLLSLMGFHVTAIERSAVVMTLVRDGLDRLNTATGSDSYRHLKLIVGDSRAVLPTLVPPDAIYLDPMFPPKRRKSAAVKKEMRLLRELVGDDLDAGNLLEHSRRIARHRVVVKRPDDAPPLVPDPSLSVSGKLVRYDIYLSQT